MAKKQDTQVQEVKSEIAPTIPTLKPNEYYRLDHKGNNLYTMVTVTVEDGNVVHVDETEPTYMAIAFDILKRRVGKQFLMGMA